MTRRADGPSRHLLVTTAFLLVVIAVSSSAVAQPASERPFRGLFGGVTGSSARVQTLNLSASLFAGYDDDIFARGAGPRPSQQRLGGSFLGAQSSLRYARRFPTATFSAGATTSMRWLSQTGEFVPTMYGGSLGYGQQLGPRTSLRLSQGVAYRPRFTLAPFSAASTIGPSLTEDFDGIDFEDDEVIGSGPPDDFGIVANRNALIYAGRVSLTRTLTTRSSLIGFGGYSLLDFRSDEFSGVSNRRYRGGVGYNYSVTQYLSARVGYAYRTFRTGSGVTNDAHDINIGVNYARPFTIGFGQNRTRLSFTTGTAAAVRDRRRLDLEEVGAGRRFILRGVGTATLLHQFVAPWQAQLRYARTVGFVDGLSDIYSGDRVTASLAGLIGRRTDVLMSLGYVSGALGLRARNFSTTLGTIRARMALTSNMGLFAQYFYYQYDYTASIADQLAIAPTLERQGVRAGLTVWLPLLR